MKDENKKLTDAKSVSKFGMVMGAFIIILMNIMYLIYNKAIPTNEEERSIIMFGGSIVIVFSPVYLAIFLDKIVSIFKKED